MSSRGRNKSITRIRTYAGDFEAAKNQEPAPQVAEIPKKIPKKEKKKLAVMPDMPVKSAETKPEVIIPQKKEVISHSPIISDLDTDTIVEDIPSNLKEDEGIVFYDGDDRLVGDTTYEENNAALREEVSKEEVTTVPISDELTKFTETPKKSILSDEGRDDTREGIGGGTIIQDRKRKRFKLVPAIGAAIKGWFVDKKESYEDSHKEKFTVAAAKSRIETIKAAAKESVRAPSQDYDVVSQKLKEAPRSNKLSTLAFKPKEAIPEPSWSHTVDEETEAPTQEEAVVEKQVSQKVVETAPEPVQEKIVETPEVPTLAPTTAPATVAAQEQVPLPTSLEPRPEITREEKNIAEPLSPQGTVAMTEPEKVRKPKKEKKEKVKKVHGGPSKILSSKFPVYFLTGVISISLVLGVGLSVVLFGDKLKNMPNTNVSETATIPTLIAAEAQIPVQYSSLHTELYTSLQSTIRETGIEQIYLVTPSETGDQLVANERIMQTISPNTSGSFHRAITDMTFAGINGQPAILMRVTNFDTGFAGMLDWEDTMSADLSPLFGAPVYESFDPQARTDTQVRNAFYKDIAVANYSARQLVDEKGQERIVYAFINKNTIVLTTTKATLETIIPLIR